MSPINYYRNLCHFSFFLLLTFFLTPATEAADVEETKFRRIPIQYIAALGEPTASSGAGAEKWGHWPVDPGPRGVWIKNFSKLEASGGRRWELAFGANLYDVTHLPCRSARYTQSDSAEYCSPASASLSDFPVQPGGIMPSVKGCRKLDYSVLFIIGVAVEES